MRSQEGGLWISTGAAQTPGSFLGPPGVQAPYRELGGAVRGARGAAPGGPPPRAGAGPPPWPAGVGRVAGGAAPDDAATSAGGGSQLCRVWVSGKPATEGPAVWTR